MYGDEGLARAGLGPVCSANSISEKDLLRRQNFLRSRSGGLMPLPSAGLLVRTAAKQCRLGLFAVERRSQS